MSGMSFFQMLIILFITIISTALIIKKGSSKKIYKYIPGMALFLGSIIFCILFTFFSTYKAYITVTVTFFAAFPGVILSELMAAVYDIINVLNVKDTHI